MATAGIEVGAARTKTLARGRLAPLPLWAWLALGAFFLFSNAVLALYEACGFTHPLRIEYLLRCVSLFLIWQWLEAECRAYRQTYPLDMGMFIALAGIALLPYYLWRNQRWWGLLKIAGLATLWAASYVLAAVAAFVARTFLAG